MTATVATAQTEWKDRYVTLAEGTQKNASIAQPAGGDYTVIVWEDYRGGESDIYAQRIENGNGIATWFPVDGVPVCTAEGEQRNPRAAFDGDGGVIITWEDYRDDRTTPFDPEENRSAVYAERILFSTGAKDANWSGGVIVSSDTSTRAYRPRIAGTNDGAYITWTQRRDSSWIDPGDSTLTQTKHFYDVFLQYLLSDGSLASGNWVQNGIQVNASSWSKRKNSELVLDSIRTTPGGRCGVIVAYEGFVIDDLQILMNRIDSSGQRLWNNRELHIAPSFTQQVNVKIAQAGFQTLNFQSNRCVAVTWEDGDEYDSTKVNVFAQLVDIDYPQEQWPDTVSHRGLPICSKLDDQVNPDIVVNLGVAGIAWEDYRDRVSNGCDVYANAVELTTMTLAQTDGVGVCTEEYDQKHLCMSDAGDLWIGWEDWRSHSSDIYYQTMDWSTFAPQLQSDGWPITLAKNDQTEPVLGGAVFVFTDKRREAILNDSQTDENIYAQTPGEEGDGATLMAWRDELTKWTLDVDASDHRFAVDGDGNTYVVWREERKLDAFSIDAKGIYAQKLDKDGVPRWTNDGIKLSEDEDSGMPDVCVADAGGAVFVWREGAVIKVMQLDASGAVVWPNESSSTDNCDQPRVAMAGGTTFVTYKDDNGIGVDLFDGTGTRTDGPPLGFTAGAAHPKICSNGADGCYIVAGSTTDIRYTYVNSTPENALVKTTIPANNYDLVIDPVSGDPDEPLQAILAYTTSGAAYVHKLVAKNGSPPTVSKVPDITTSARVASGGGTFSSVCVDADSIANTESTLGGGAILAWNHLEYIPGLGSSSHIVKTQRVDWTGVSDTVSLKWWPEISLVSTSSCQGGDAKPDIVWRWNPDAGHVYGVVGWEDHRSQWVGSGSAIITQMVDYGVTPQNALLWGAAGEQLSPQTGSGAQEYIQIEKSASASGVGKVSGYWLDGRAGSPIVAGMMFDDLMYSGSHHLALQKRQETTDLVASTIALGQNYPNPVSIAAHGSARIAFELAREGACTIRLFDALGRGVATLVDGWRSAGAHIAEVPGSVLGTLPAGIYRYELRTGKERASRLMILVK